MIETLKQILEHIDYDEKVAWFNLRTKHHIDLVKKYCQKIYNYDPKRFREILERAKIHDASKYRNPEYDPYIDISWQYHMKKYGMKYEVSSERQEELNQASIHHVKVNPHHPEYHSRQTNVINLKERDKAPDKIIDATKMDDLSIAEMVADWSAISEEVGDTPKQWADKQINKRWKFTPKQTKLIYELIKAIW